MASNLPLGFLFALRSIDNNPYYLQTRLPLECGGPFAYSPRVLIDCPPPISWQQYLPSEYKQEGISLRIKRASTLQGHLPCSHDYLLLSMSHIPRFLWLFDEALKRVKLVCFSFVAFSKTQGMLWLRAPLVCGWHGGGHLSLSLMTVDGFSIL